MGLGKTLGITIFIIAVIFVGIYLFYNNQQIPITIIGNQQAAQNKVYQDFKNYVSNITNIPVNNIINTTPFPEMTSVIFTTPNNITWTRIPYNNNYIYAISNFTLIFSKNDLLFNVTNNSIVSVIFVVATQKQYQSKNFYNLTYQESLPRITIPYYITKNNLAYTFKIYNPNNYPSNITIQKLPMNLSLLSTIGFTYNNKFYIILYQ
ncbi:MAG: hypothetical protein QXU98_11440 [Candidatus Parvarchaeota archaeon]